MGCRQVHAGTGLAYCFYPYAAQSSGPYSEVFRLDLAGALAVKVCRHPETGAPDPDFAPA